MQINVKLDQGFTDQFYELSKKYGDEMRNLNGLSEGQLNFTEFIDHFVDKNSKNVADASIDGNSNVGTKDVTSLLNEMNKPHMKLLSLNKIYYEMKKQHGARKANEWLEGEWSGKFYLHDSFNSSFLPYSYKGTELVFVKYKGQELLTSFEQLYDLVEEDIVLLSEEDQAYCKYTNDLLVLDTNNEWTGVKRVIRKPKTQNFHFVKANNGMTEIVTSNHPIITKNGDKDAKDVICEKDVIFTEKFEKSTFGNVNEIFCLDYYNKDRQILFRGENYMGGDTHLDGQVCYSCAMNPIQNRIKCDFDFGWLVGIIIAEGTTTNGIISISQNKGSIFDKIVETCERLNFGYRIYNTELKKCFRIVIRSEVLADVIANAICERGLCHEKKLRPTILNFNREFLKGIIGGVLDGDGTLTQTQGRRIHIRMTSRTLINQLAFIARMFGYTVREQTPCIYNAFDGENGKIVQHKYIYHFAFTPYSDVENFDSIKIREHGIEFTSSEDEGRYTNGKYTFGYGEKLISNNEVLELDTDEYVYDITTETGHFMCNGILSHNCYSYDLERVAKEGLFFVNDFNHEAPKHLVTFTDFVAEFVSWVSNRTSGGCSIPNYLIWSYYFWKHDVENGYFIRDPEYYRRQEFQRMIFKLNQPYLRITQSAYTTLSIMDEDYLVELFGGLEFPDGTLAIDHIEDIIEHEKVFMDVMRECHETNMMTFPVVSNCLIFDYEKHRFKHEEFARWCSDTNAKWMDCNFSIDDAVNALSSCCRLRNSLEINNLGNFSSIGGSALEVGSVKVNSINLARIAYECKDEDDYIAILEKRVALCCEVLQVIRSIITRNVEKGLLPNYTLDIIDVSKQYCTIGVNALFEAVRKMGYVQKDEFECTNYTDRGIEFAKRIFDTITKVKQEYTDKYGFLYNIEQIPGERAAAVFLQKDKILFPNEEYTSTLYSNQWISLSEKTTMHDKVEVGEQLDSYMGGGVISHYNFDSSFADKEQAWKLLNYIADHHIPYFAFNGKVNSCEHNHGFYEDTCPICGGKPVTTWTRVVGFCVPRKNMSKERRVEHDHRWWEENKKFDFDSLM